MNFIRLKHLTLNRTIAATALVCAASVGISGAHAQTLSSNETGTHDGFYYSFWKDSGDATFGLESGGRYTSQWSNSTNNWVGGKGWNPGGPRVVNYSGTYNVDNSQNSYLALYGWTKSPLVEYYVIESYGSYNPSSCTEGRQTFGSFESDGATYSLVRCQRIQQPSIEGTATFDQYFSVREPKKGFGNISGTITVANHFAAWESAGLRLGSHDYMVMATEGYQSSGSSDITVSEGAGGGAGGGGNTWDNGGNTGGNGGNTWDNGGNAGDNGGNTWDNGGNAGGNGGNTWDNGGNAGGNGGNTWDNGGNAGGNGGNTWDNGGNAGGNGGNTWDNGGNTWDNGGNTWDNGGNTWDNGGNTWDNGGNTWDNGGNTWDNGGNTWDNGGNTWDNGGNTWNNGGNTWDNGGNTWDNGGNTWDNDGNAAANGGNGAGAGGTCNWYGTSYPLCTNTASGWGWENNQSCITSSTCDSQ